MTSWRGLGAFWLVLLLLVGGAAAVLQVLGPPQPAARPPRAATTPQPAAAPAASSPKPPLVSQHRDIAAADRPGRDTPGPIADPDPALLEPGPGGPSDKLPRIAEDGRRPMQFYAAGFDRSSRRPRIGLVLAGIGMNQADSEAAIHALPGGVTLAISPYGTGLPKLLTAARVAEHEYLLSIPMEPQGFPANDPGPRALMTSLSAVDTMDRFRWLLAHVQGYVGVTNALGAMRGERFSGMPDRIAPILAELAHRGLLFIDGRPAGSGGAAMQRQVWSRNVDLVVDEPPADIDTKLAQLEELARDRSDALGLAGAPSPVSVQHLAAWANGLLDRGFVLAPVSALVHPPSDLAASAQ